jgi:hypothetical protein
MSCYVIHASTLPGSRTRVRYLVRCGTYLLERYAFTDYLMLVSLPALASLSIGYMNSLLVDGSQRVSLTEFKCHGSHARQGGSRPVPQGFSPFLLIALEYN